MDTRKKALESVRSLADEALRNRYKAKKTPLPEVKPEAKAEPEFSPEDEEQLTRLYEQEANGRA